MVPKESWASPCVGPYLPELLVYCDLCDLIPPVWQNGVWAHFVRIAEEMLLEMEGRGVKQSLIPNMGQLKFANVPVKGWIIDPDVHGLFDGSSGVLYVCAHCGEIVHADVMPRSVAMVIDGEGALRCSLSLSPKVIADCPMYSFAQSTWSHVYL